MTAYPFSHVESLRDRPAGGVARRCAVPGEWAPALGAWILRLPKPVWMVVDAGLCAAGVLLGQRLFASWIPADSLMGDANVIVATLVLAWSVVLSGLMFGLYEPATLWQRSRIAARSLLAITVAMLMACLVLHLLMYSQVSRRAAAAGTTFYLMTAPLIRLAAHRAVITVRRGLLLLGASPTVLAIARAVRRGAVPGYRLAGIIIDRGAAPPDIPGLAFVGDPSQAESACRAHDVREVVVAAGAETSDAVARAALACLGVGCRVTDETTFHETCFGEVPSAGVTPQWFLRADLKGHLEEHATAKRCFDAVLAALGLVASLPLWPIIMLAIVLESRGSIFYSQVRVGQAGRLFRIHKFRTMRRDAEANGCAWSSADDPRVTRVGRVLRRLRLDELPQLWNILKGEMSIVGPRPERPEFVAPLSTLIPFYNERHLVKPGLTGWAQINFRYGSSVEDARRKLQLDLHYIKHMCFELDLVICLRTFGMVVTGAC